MARCNDHTTMLMVRKGVWVFDSFEHMMSRIYFQDPLSAVVHFPGAIGLNWVLDRAMDLIRGLAHPHPVMSDRIWHLAQVMRKHAGPHGVPLGNVLGALGPYACNVIVEAPSMVPPMATLYNTLAALSSCGAHNIMIERAFKVLCETGAAKGAFAISDIRDALCLLPLSKQMRQVVNIGALVSDPGEVGLGDVNMLVSRVAMRNRVLQTLAFRGRTWRLSRLVQALGKNVWGVAAAGGVQADTPESVVIAVKAVGPRKAAPLIQMLGASARDVLETSPARAAQIDRIVLLTHQSSREWMRHALGVV